MSKISLAQEFPPKGAGQCASEKKALHRLKGSLLKYCKEKRSLCNQFGEPTRGKCLRKAEKDCGKRSADLAAKEARWQQQCAQPQNGFSNRRFDKTPTTGTYQTYTRDFDGRTLRPLRVVKLVRSGSAYLLTTPDGTFRLTRTPSGQFLSSGSPPVSVGFVRGIVPQGSGEVQYDVYFRNQRGNVLKSETWIRRKP